MKQYILSKIRCTIEAIIVVLAICFCMQKECINKTTTTVVENESLAKALDREVIQENQNNIYKQGTYNPLFTFKGELTGYVGDCPLCTGYLACPPRTNVLKEGIYYKDKTYGTVRIVASSKNYPCGTILRFKVNKLSSEPIIAIVLDRGVSGNVIDLLTDDKNYAIRKVGRVRNLEFEVLRKGWKK